MSAQELCPCLCKDFAIEVILRATVDVRATISGFASIRSVCTYVEHREGIFCFSQLPTIRSCNVSFMFPKSNTRPVAYRERESEGNDLEGCSPSVSPPEDISPSFAHPSHDNRIIIHAHSLDHPNSRYESECEEGRGET